MSIHDVAKLLYVVAILAALASLWPPARTAAIPFGIATGALGGLVAIGGS